MPGKIVFVVNNDKPNLTQQGHSDFYIFFDPPRGGLSYRLDLTNMAITSYKNGQFVSDCGAPPISQCRDWQPVAALDPASGIQSDGSVRLVIDKAQLGIKTGDVLLGVFIREDTAGNPSTVLASDYAGGRQDYLVVGNDYCARPPTPAAVVSRKTHGTADYDVDLLPPAAGIECRSGGTNGDFKMIVTFPLPVAVTGTPKASVTSGTGSVSNVSVNANQVTVDLTGLTNAQRLTVTLNGVTDGGGVGNVPINMAVLAGDTTADGNVNSTDISQTKSQSGQSVSNSNFREDLTVDGNINSTDIGFVKSKSGTGLP
jgi:hypothetical protein